MDNNNINNKSDKNIDLLNNKNKDKEKENIYQEILNNLNKSKTNDNNNIEENPKKEEKDFSQQVDFLYHKNNPEGQSSVKNILIKQYKKNKNLQIDKTKDKQRKNYKSNSPRKKIIPYANKNKGLFDPYLSQKELDYESNIEKQRAERQKKIDEYEKNKSRKKLKKDLDKKILNINKPHIKSALNHKNYKTKKAEKKNEELITHFVQVPKPKVKKNYSKNFGFQPKKYDMIINSLINEMNQEKKDTNLNLCNKIKKYARNNIDAYNNYYEYIYRKSQKDYQSNNKNEQNIKPTRAQIIKGLMKKFFGEENEKQSQQNKIKKINNKKNKNKVSNKKNEINIKNDVDIINNNNLLLNLDLDDNNNNEEINFDNIDKLLSSEKINFQDKINIISELNKNIDKYYQAMPILVNQVQDSLDKIYKNNAYDENFRNEANKVPYISMASKAAYQIIQTNIDSIIENLINELIYDTALDIHDIIMKKEYLNKKNELVDKFHEVKNNIDDILGQEKNIIEENTKFIEDNKNKNNEKNNMNKKNKIIIKKYKANLDDNIIKRNEKYKNDFKEYMIFKGSFYADNIFAIYDEFIEEEANNILDKLINKFIEELNIN